VIVVCQEDNFLAISWHEQVTFRRDGDDVHFILDQQAFSLIFIELGHWNNSPVGHIILFPSQLVLLLPLNAEKQQSSIL
jgi:hypothetical protein